MATDIYSLIAKRIREERKSVGLSIEKLAEAADIGASFLAYIETEGRKPSLTTIAKLADALDIPVEKLFKGLPPRPSRGDERYIRQFAALIRPRTPAQKSALLKAVKALSSSFR